MNLVIIYQKCDTVPSIHFRKFSILYKKILEKENYTKRSIRIIDLI